MADTDIAAARELLRDSFTRLIEHVDDLADGLTDEVAYYQPAPGANTITWLLWHSARVQDAQLSEIAGTDQVWFRDGWVDRFGLDLPKDSHGYGHTPEQVAKVRAPADLLAGYYRAVHAMTLAYVASVTAEELERSWTAAGHRRSPRALASSASSTTARSTSGRRPTSAASSLDRRHSKHRHAPGNLGVDDCHRVLRWWPPIGILAMVVLGVAVGKGSTPVDDWFIRVGHAHRSLSKLLIFARSRGGELVCSRRGRVLVSTAVAPRGAIRGDARPGGRIRANPEAGLRSREDGRSGLSERPRHGHHRRDEHGRR